MAEKDVLGRAGEERAAAYLQRLGWRIVARNWRCPTGELDIVAIDGDVVVAVEVKTRAGLGYGHPFEAITARKLHRLHVLARSWAAEQSSVGARRRLRVDAIAVVGADPAVAAIEHLRDLR